MNFIRTFAIILTLLYSPLGKACDAIWVRVASGNVMAFGKWRSIEPTAAVLKCNETTELPLNWQQGRFVRFGTAIDLYYDGTRLTISALVISVDVFPSPVAQETFVLNEKGAFQDFRLDVARMRQ